MYFRDIIECIKALFGYPEFAPYLKLRPERHYADEDQTIRLFHDMHTGKWWWDTQVRCNELSTLDLEVDIGVKDAIEKRTPGATIIPIIISTDKTQLTLFRNKSAYPVYMTIGNLPKDIRRKPSRQGYILLGYLPTAKLEHITNKASRRRAMSNLFHACMSRIVRPMVDAGRIGISVARGDGAVFRGHPILAAYIGDYPEQILVTCLKNLECPQCPVPLNELGNGDATYPLRKLQEVLDALGSLDDGAAEYVKACKDAGIKPVFHPFWEDLPYVNIFRSITPDVLHQLYQGVLKHLKEWIFEAYGTAEIDARCRRLPPNHNIRLFMNGISGLSRVSGTEHDQICRFLLGIIIDLPLPGGYSNMRLIRAVRGLLDFLYLSQYPIHSTETLQHMNNALDRFHTNKDIFIDLGIRSSFNIPKLHFARHYLELIQRYGTTDNFNTQYTERLHIDLAKDAYRATNSKDEYPQMTLWLQRKEKIYRHEKYIFWRLAGSPQQLVPVPPGIQYERHLKMTKHPTKDAVPFSKLETEYGAKFFRDALARYVVKLNDPGLRPANVEDEASHLSFPFRTVPVYHKVKFVGSDPSVTLDAVHIKPAGQNKRGQIIPARFDTVLVNDGTGGQAGVKGSSIFLTSSFLLFFANN